VFEMLAFALPRCPRLEVVFVERLGHTLQESGDVAHYREDYQRVRAIVAAAGPSRG